MPTYSGTWKRQSVTPTTVRLVPDADPEHAVPTDNEQITWVSTVIAPMLPDSMVGDQYLQPPVPVMLVDRDVDDPAHGGGIRPGDSTYGAQDRRDRVHGEDLGAVDARRWAPTGSRDGSYNVRTLDDTPGMGDSSDWARARYESGVGAASDPHARTGRRIVRWRDRYIDMHRWESGPRATVARQAYTAPQSAPLIGNQYVSPAPLFAQAGQHGIGTPDQFVWPEDRRAPRPWDESGMAATDGNGGSYGLTVWGL